MPQLSITERHAGRSLKITPVTPGERDEKLREAIVRRAYRISEDRIFAPGHELEDWRRAESETLRRINCGFLMLDDKIALSTDAAVFKEGEIEICVEPRRLTVCGKEQPKKPAAAPQTRASSAEDNLIFLFYDLPMEIEPSQVTARFKGRRLEIDLPKARATLRAQVDKNAA